MSLPQWLAEQRRRREAAGLHRKLHPRPPRGSLVDLAGNDYLGLGQDPRVRQAAADAAQTWGAGAGASRLVTGTLELHTELEQALAAFTGREAALAFSTGYQANLAVVATLSDPDTLIISDAHVHASLVDACRLARRASLAIVAHNNLQAVETALRERPQRRALVLVESVYSVLGDSAPLEALATLVRRYDAVLIVDEAHAIGVAGPGGRGLVAEAGLSRRADVVVTMTLSKSLASQGGAVLASTVVVEHLVNTARPFIYDTGLAPPAAGAAIAALALVAQGPSLPERVRELAASFAGALGQPSPAGAVLSVPMGEPEAALQAQAEFAADGYLVGCFRPPSVPDGVSRLRITARASLTDAQAEAVIARLALVPSHR